MPSPYPYQVEGIDFLVRAERAILGDEPGLGKTPQSLLAAQKLDAFPILVVCPKNAFGVWEDEAAKWLDMPVHTYVGSSRRLPKETPPIVVTSYGVFPEILSRRAWRLTVYDEAHRLRNRKTRTLFKEAVKTPSKYLHLLSGTPQVGDVDDLWALFHLCRPKQWTSYWRFVDRYMFMEKDFLGHYQISGARNMAEMRQLASGFFLRRLERDVAPERPPLTRQPIPLILEGAQKRAYDQMADDLLITIGDNWTAAPTQIARDTRLRQLLVTPLLLDIPDEGAAFRALRETLEDTPRPAVVFTPFEKAIPLLIQYLKGIANCSVITGNISAKRTQEVWHAFQASKDPRRLLIATVQSGTSWSATSANHAFMLGYDWAPTTMYQAEKRLSRHGQHHPVVVHYFLHRGTFDDYMMDVLDQKTTWRKIALDPQTMLRPNFRG